MALPVPPRYKYMSRNIFTPLHDEHEAKLLRKHPLEEFSEYPKDVVNYRDEELRELLKFYTESGTSGARKNYFSFLRMCHYNISEKFTTKPACIKGSIINLNYNSSYLKERQYYSYGSSSNLLAKYPHGNKDFNVIFLCDYKDFIEYKEEKNIYSICSSLRQRYSTKYSDNNWEGILASLCFVFYKKVPYYAIMVSIKDSLHSSVSDDIYFFVYDVAESVHKAIEEAVGTQEEVVPIVEEKEEEAEPLRPPNSSGVEPRKKRSFIERLIKKTL